MANDLEGEGVERQVRYNDKLFELVDEGRRNGINPNLTLIEFIESLINSEVTQVSSSMANVPRVRVALEAESMSKTNDAIANGGSPASPNRFEVAASGGFNLIEGQIIYTSPGGGLALHLDEFEGAGFTTSEIVWSHPDIADQFGWNSRVGFPVAATATVVTFRGFATLQDSGTISLGWAQDMANALPVTILAGSYLKTTDVANADPSG